MSGRGIHYDVGTTPDGRSSRPVFDPVVVQREMHVIATDLRCTAVRIAGQDLDRITVAARFAAYPGLQVWFSPHPCEMTQGQLRPYFLDCAQRAEQLRCDGADVVLVTGCELSLFTVGYLPGASFGERMHTLTASPEQRAEALASIPAQLNGFLGTIASAAREVFHGPLTYASIAIEHVDWTPFDIVGIDHYRSQRNAATYQQQLRTHAVHGKPIAVTEVGCCTYRGAGDLGAAGWLILHADGTITPGTVRDEHEQVRYMHAVLPVLWAEGVDTVFWFTLAAYTLPHRPDPARDADVGSYGITKILDEGTKPQHRRYPDLPWEPKAGFDALAAHYSRTST